VSLPKAVGGCGRLSVAVGGCGRLSVAVGGCGRLWGPNIAHCTCLDCKVSRLLHLKCANVYFRTHETILWEDQGSCQFESVRSSNCYWDSAADAA
jgi:hypothetical protein